MFSPGARACVLNKLPILAELEMAERLELRELSAS